MLISFRISAILRYTQSPAASLAVLRHVRHCSTNSDQAHEIFHRIRGGNKESLMQLFNDLPAEKRLDFASRKLYQNATPLHIVSTYKTPDEVAFVLAQLGDKAYTVCKQIDGNHNLPLHALLANSSHDLQDPAAVSVRQQIQHYTFHHPRLKHMHEPMRFSEVLLNFPTVTADSPIWRNLQYAVHACNLTRSIIKYNSSHPCMNDSDEEFVKYANKNFLASRKQVETLLYNHQDDRVLINKEIIKLLTTSRAGTCLEYSILLGALLRTQFGIRETLDECAVQYGDHVTLLFGRKEDSERNIPQTWGSDAFICDAWAGNIFPASDYLQKIKAYEYFQLDKKLKNVCVEFCESHHRLYAR